MQVLAKFKSDELQRAQADDPIAQAIANFRADCADGGIDYAEKQAMRKTVEFCANKDPKGWAAKIAARFDAAYDAPQGARFDSAGAGVALDFTHVRKEIVEPRYRPNVGLSIYPVEEDIPPGAEAHTKRIGKNYGKPARWTGGKDFPVVGVAQEEQLFKTAYYAIAMETNLMERQASDMASLNAYKRKGDAAMRAVDFLIEELIFRGDPDAKLYGVLNYPGQPRAVSGKVYGSALAYGDAYDDILHWITAGMDDGSARRNRMAVSRSLLNYIMKKRNGNTDKPLMESILESNSFITSMAQVAEAPYLNGAGPNGEDGLHLFNAEVDSVAFHFAMRPTVIPVISNGLYTQDVIVFQTGGVTMVHGLDNLLVWIPRS